MLSLILRIISSILIFITSKKKEKKKKKKRRKHKELMVEGKDTSFVELFKLLSSVFEFLGSE